VFFPGVLGAARRTVWRPNTRPFETEILGALAIVERVDLNDAVETVAICRRGKQRQMIPILNLPLPSLPPAGWEWIEAYRRWARGM